MYSVFNKGSVMKTMLFCSCVYDIWNTDLITNISKRMLSNTGDFVYIEKEGIVTIDDTIK